ncbi:MAG TPA: retropepsin-like aspartic protease [Humisphaera sp.]|jgi:aspartyl protease family protein|nr:retropepsin-like aspartic protease [Humisphaera sp.]
MTHRHSLILSIVCLMLASICRADDPAPADVLKDKGLIKASGIYVAAGEPDVLTAMRQLRVARKKLDDELKVRQAQEQRIKAAKNTINGWVSDYTALNDRMASISDPTQQNQIIGRMNGLAGRIKQGTEEVTTMEQQAAKVGTKSKAEFADAVLVLAPKAEEITEHYKDWAADEAVKNAISKINETARPKVRMGPTPEFASASNLLKKWRSEIEDEVIPVKMENGVPTIEVTLNGTLTRTMIFDTGASIVSLPADLAAELNMVPGPRDPEGEVSMADGHTIKVRKMHLKSVRVGRFVVEDVECVVLPRSATNAPPLLGDAFFSHFAFKLNANAGELRLTDLAGASKDVTIASDKKDPKSSPGRAGKP